MCTCVYMWVGGWVAGGGGWVRLEMGVKGEEGMCERFCEPESSLCVISKA